MMLLRHAKPVTKYAGDDSFTSGYHTICQDVKMYEKDAHDWTDTSDRDSLPSLCSESDPEDKDQHDSDDLELSLVYA
jgi:hypothetical protein